MLGELDHEERRAVHQHHVAGTLDADAVALGQGIDRAREDGRADRQAGRCGSGRVQRSDRLDGIHEARPLDRGRAGHAVPSGVPPLPGGHVVQRVGAAGGVAVEDVLAGEPEDGVRRRAEDPPRRLPQLRLLLGDPRELGTYRLAREQVAAAPEQRLLAELCVGRGDLGLGPGVDAVEDPGPQWRPGRVGRHDRGPDPAERQGSDLRGGDITLGPQGSEHPAHQPDRLLEPHRVHVVLEVAGCRRGRAVVLTCRREHLSALVDGHGLAAAGADVNSQEDHSCPLAVRCRRAGGRVRGSWGSGSARPRSDPGRCR